MNHGHSVGVSGYGHSFVLDGATGLGDVLDAILGGLVNVITEGEEGVRDEGDVVHGLDEFVLLLLSERLGNDFEQGLPLFILDFGEVALDVADASIDTVLLLHSLLELQAQDLGMLAEVPQGGLTSLFMR